MPIPLAELTLWLSDELAWLHLKWSNYRALFGKDKEQIDLLNEAAPAFFHNLQRSLWEDILLHLARITDASETGGHGNLTIRRLPDCISPAAVRNGVQDLVNVALAKTKFAKEWRNIRLAHRDFPTDSGTNARVVPPASRADIEDALGALRVVMNLVHKHLDGSQVGYEHTIGALGGVDSLIRHLRIGVDERKRRIKARRSSM